MGALLTLTKEVHTDVGNAVKKSTGVEKILQRGNKENALSETEYLTENLKATHQKTGQMVTEAEKCKGTIDEHEKRIERLEDFVMKYQPQLDKLKEVEIANDFEYHLAKYIYPRGTEIGSNEIFRNLIQWLDVNQNIPNHDGNRKWNTLPEIIGWTEEHGNVLRRMLNLRSTNPDRPYVEGIRTMAQQLETLNNA